MNSAEQAARQASNHPVVENGARVGYAVNGVLHLLIAWIALRVAFGGGGSADQSGALSTLASNTGGKIILWIGVVGFALLAVWQLVEAIVGASGEATDRIKAAAKTVVYAVLAWSSYKFATGGGSSGQSKQQSTDFTQTLMDAPAGRILVGLLGLGVVGVGGYHIYKGAKKKFLEDLEEHPGTWAVYAGQAGYIAKGIALAVVGFLFLVAAFKKSPGEATGLDGALHTLREQPFGTVLLLVVALGLAAYGIYSFARARHAKV